MAFTDSAHLHSCCSLFWNYTAGGEKLKEAENESECSAPREENVLVVSTFSTVYNSNDSHDTYVPKCFIQNTEHFVTLCLL